MTATSASRRRGLSLATRIFLATSLLIALAVGGAVAVTSVLIKRIARQSAVESLENSASVQSMLEKQRYQRLDSISRPVVADSSFVAYIAQASEQGDRASILDQLAERQRDVGFDFAIVLDPNGRVIARTDRPGEAGEDLSHRPLVARVLSEFEASGVWQERGGLFYAVAVPISRDFTAYGYLVTGFRIDEAQALDVKRLSGADVAFVAMPGGQPQIVATTLPRDTASSLLATLRGQGRMMGRVMDAGEMLPREELSVRGEPWLALIAPLRDAAGKPAGATVALASLPREQAPFSDIQNALLGAGAVALLLAFPLSFFFARRTLGPVRRLAGAAEAARQGNYDQKIAPEAGARVDEVGRLAVAFDELLSDLREKRDMEAYLTELSRNLPEPAQAHPRGSVPLNRDLLLMGVELKGYAFLKGDSGPQATLERLAADLERVRAAVAGAGGEIEAVAGHRLIARFAGEGRALRAVAAAAAVLSGVEEEQAHAIALAAGRTVSGPVALGDRAEGALVGLPVQQLESLHREAAAGEILLAREVYKELAGPLTQAGYDLAPRRGVLAPQPLYVLRAEIAERLGRGVQAGAPGTPGPAGAPAAPGSLAEAFPAGAQATLSGIEPGTLMAHRFEILAVLGSGGMGVVYKARDRELDDLVALKMLRREALGDRTQLERLKSEIKLARKITHPNVLRTFDFGEIDGMPFISMEYVRGVTLRYLLDQTHRLPYSAGLRLAKQLAAGLGAAHAVGVMHRDIKPENLILEPTGNAKLMDFGIARPVERRTPGQTQAGWVVGTPQYLSPEQLQGGDIDERADIYSCGIVLYEIFTGELPFSAPTQVELLLKHIQEEPPPPSVHWPEIPGRLQEIILCCLKKEPLARYRTATDLLHDLEELAA